MVGLLDIAEVPPETVNIRGTEVSVNGLSAQTIAQILTRFESLQKMLVGEVVFGPKIILEAGPDVIAGIIAAGTGQFNNPEVEAKALTLNVGEQYELVTKIIDLTFGKSMGPFVEKVRGLLGSVNVPSDEPGKAPSTNSRAQSRASLRSATTPEMFGSTRHVSSQRTPN